MLPGNGLAGAAGQRQQRLTFQTALKRFDLDKPAAERDRQFDKIRRPIRAKW